MNMKDYFKETDNNDIFQNQQLKQKLRKSRKNDDNEQKIQRQVLTAAAVKNIEHLTRDTHPRHIKPSDIIPENTKQLITEYQEYLPGKRFLVGHEHPVFTDTKIPPQLQRIAKRNQKEQKTKESVKHKKQYRSIYNQVQPNRYAQELKEALFRKDESLSINYETIPSYYKISPSILKWRDNNIQNKKDIQNNFEHKIKNNNSLGLCFYPRNTNDQAKENNNHESNLHRNLNHTIRSLKDQSQDLLRTKLGLPHFTDEDELSRFLQQFTTEELQDEILVVLQHLTEHQYHHLIHVSSSISSHESKPILLAQLSNWFYSRYLMIHTLRRKLFTNKEGLFFLLLILSSIVSMLSNQEMIFSVRKEIHSVETQLEQVNRQQTEQHFEFVSLFSTLKMVLVLLKISIGPTFCDFTSLNESVPKSYRLHTVTKVIGLDSIQRKQILKFSRQVRMRRAYTQKQIQDLNQVIFSLRILNDIDLIEQNPNADSKLKLSGSHKRSVETYHRSRVKSILGNNVFAPQRKNRNYKSLLHYYKQKLREFKTQQLILSNISSIQQLIFMYRAANRGKEYQCYKYLFHFNQKKKKR